MVGVYNREDSRKQMIINYWYLKMFCGSAIKSVFINSTLKQLGMKHIKWLSFGNIDKSSAQRRKQYLESLVQKI
ncbi:MAG: hypothetical protein SOV68_12595 [Ligilactobacillus salivarius]|nr:hypothetical protein [Ligilactobacillus salivarius]